MVCNGEMNIQNWFLRDCWALYFDVINSLIVLNLFFVKERKKRNKKEDAPKETRTHSKEREGLRQTPDLYTKDSEVTSRYQKGNNGLQILLTLIAPLS